MRTYIEAYNASGGQILGNLDGQDSLNVRDYRRTYRYKAFRNGTFHKCPRVAYWRFVQNDKVLATIKNPHFAA